MPKKNNTPNYFPHDSNARNSDKMIRLRMVHKAAGYGVYFMILERLREEATYMSVRDYNMIAFDLRVDASLVKSVVEDFGLFVVTPDGNYFYSESFNERMAVKDEKSRKRAEAGREGMRKRYEKGEDVTKPSENGNNVITNLPQNGNKKSKEKDIYPPLYSPPLQDDEEETLPPKPPEPVTTGHITLDEFRRRITGNPMSNAINEELRRGLGLGDDTATLEKWIDDYIAIQTAAGNTRNYFTEYRKHFVNWARIKKSTLENGTKEEPRPRYYNPL